MYVNQTGNFTHDFKMCSYRPVRASVLLRHRRHHRGVNKRSNRKQRRGRPRRAGPGFLPRDRAGGLCREEQRVREKRTLRPRGGRERRLGLEQVSAIQLKGITKRFGRVVANDGIDLEVRRGEILSLLGENGSGKTTLMNMISGIYFPDEGHICVGGREVTIRSPKDAYALGIGMIHQLEVLVEFIIA